jgi:diguanylate cyclase (GGDEF)-like protein
MLARIETLSLRSRFGRRVFLLFALCAVVPIAVAWFFSFLQVQRASRQAQLAELRDYSSTYGQGLLQRLQAADAGLRSIAANWEAGSLPDPRDTRESARLWHAVAVITDSGLVITQHGSIEPLPDLDQAAFRRIESGSSALAIGGGANGEPPRVYIIAPLRGIARSRLVGAIAPQFLFGDPSTLPFRTTLRVLTANGHLVYSSAPPGEKSADASPTAAARWELFLGASFGAPSLIIESSQPRIRYSEATSGLGGFTPWALLGATLLVCLLSSTQIRRSLEPLDQLLQGTRRVAAREFATRVQVHSGDEFQELADSFNTMSESLGVQFSALEALAEIDRLILVSPGIEIILETLLTHVRKVTGCTCVSVTLVDPDENGRGRVYLHDGETGVDRDIKRIVIRGDSSELAEVAGSLLDLGGDEQAIPSYAVNVAGRGARWALVQPVRSGQGLNAILTLGYREVPDRDGVQASFARDFADRLAVAINSLEREERLYRQAHYDELTSMPNRQLLKDRLLQDVARASRSHELLALLYIDLDNFKRVNDTLGHGAGDELLQVAARRLAACTKQSDTVARLGGDEFVVILGALQHADDAGKVAERMLMELALPVTIQNHEFRTRASIGIALCPDDGTTPEELLKNADTAMYRAKEDGRARATFFEAHMNERAQERWSLETGLHRALQLRQFVLHYQPQYMLANGALSGAEALIRWMCPGHGQRPPAHFIAAAEELGLIADIGDWVLNEACEQYERWQREGTNVPRVAINVSPGQLRHKAFAGRVRDALIRFNVPPWALELEITESVLLSGDEQTTQTLSDLVALGVSISLDDFGTGYSSLSYLRRYPMDVIKIDRSFVSDIPDNPDACAISTAVVAMAKSLRKHTVAEGIETTAQLEFLRTLGCDSGQGYLFSQAVTAEELARLVRDPPDTLRPLMTGHEPVPQIPRRAARS